MRASSSPGRLRRYVHYLCRFACDRLVLMASVGETSNTLLIVRPDGIGDFVAWLDSARAMRAHYPDHEIVLVAHRVFADLAAKLDLFDQVVEVDTHRLQWDLRYRFERLRDIRRKGAEVTIHPLHARRFWIGDAIVRVSGANRRIGYEADPVYLVPWQRKISDRWYSELVPASGAGDSEWSCNAAFLDHLGIERTKHQSPLLDPMVELPYELNIDEPFFIVFPGAGSHKRKWPAEYFAQVAKTIGEMTSWRLVACGDSSDEVMSAQIVELAAIDGAKSLAGRTTVLELVELIRGAQLVIANETSAVHIAAAVGTPSICLLGGGHYGRFVPYPDDYPGERPRPVHHPMPCYGCNWDCTEPHQAGAAAPCLEAISVTQVVEAVKQLITGEIRHAS